jgi:hypothetical protein
MSATLKVGDRVRVTALNQMQGCRPGDKGTVLRVGKLVTTGSPYSTVAMDKGEPDSTGVIFAEGEVEADV